MRYALIADDVTGAMDTGVQVLKCRHSAIVVLDAKDYPYGTISHKGPADDFTIINTNTRWGSQQEAFKKVSDTAKLLRERRLELVYKKIDSTMRGNVGAEIKALLQTTGAKAVVMTPAIPSNGRVVVNGSLLVNKVPLEKTAFAEYPASKIKDSYIPNIISSQFDGGICVLRQNSAARMSSAISNGIADNTKVFVIDAETTEDLANIIKSIYNRRQSLLLCGSAGLFEQYIRLSFTCDKTAGGRYRPVLSAQNKDKPVLTVSGSMNEATYQQIDYACENSRSATELVQFDANSIADEKTVLRFAELIRDKLGKETNVIFAPSRRRLPERTHPAAVVKTMALILKRALASRVDIAGFVLVGGDTCYHCLRGLSVRAIRILDELEPYVPIGRLIEGPFDSFPVITKAGGFGKTSVLLDGINYLKGFH